MWSIRYVGFSFEKNTATAQAINDSGHTSDF